MASGPSDVATMIADVGDDPARVATARALFREYESELEIDLCFQHFDTEVMSLPGAYSPPRGTLLLAALDGATVGCVGLRELDGRTAELKRLYVRPSARGLGIARTLACAALDHARGQRYARVVLDTLPSMAAAQRIYTSLGFCDVEPYTDNPVDGARFMGLALG